MADTPEFSRILRFDQIGESETTHHIAAKDAERVALARRFALRALARLEAHYSLRAVAGGWQAEGTMRAEVVQACVATGEDVPATLNAPFAIRFVRDAQPDAEEVELSEDDCDVVPLEEDRIDMGEAVAQTLALNLDPYPRARDAEKHLRAMGVKTEEESGPLGGLRALLEGKKGS